MDYIEFFIALSDGKMKFVNLRKLDVKMCFHVVSFVDGICH